MPRRRTQIARQALTSEMKAELLYGWRGLRPGMPTRPGDDNADTDQTKFDARKSAFASEDERREAWAEYGPTLSEGALQRCVAFRLYGHPE
jgi:hypothetical protein